tara:strand:+ start:109 stop:402 length:294 start_codon:yes stop_codon:yes gene_type:complete
MGIIKIKELNERTPAKGAFDGVVVAKIVEKKDIREVTTQFGQSKVCDCVVEDDSGRISYTLWGKNTDEVIGADVVIENGFIDEWNDQLQLKKGKKNK